MHIFYSPPKNITKNFDFHKNVDELLENSVPPLGAEGQHPLFKKAGYTYSGICDGWMWHKNVELTESEKWQLIAMSALYWKDFYEWLNDKEEYKKYKRYLKRCSRDNPNFIDTLNNLTKQEEALDGVERSHFNIDDYD